MHNVAIIHFSPLELYPPIQNLINCVDQVESKVQYTIYTTSTTIKELTPITVKSPNVKITRLGYSGKELNILLRYISYITFHLGTFFSLIYNFPTKVLYYETFSFLPVYLYKFCNQKVSIWAHYHEYTTPQEYLSGMSLTRSFHALEKKYYALMDVVSHTNADRMNFFLEDIYPLKPRSTFILPNYPPKWWGYVNNSSGKIIRIVYVGALSLDTMFTREFASWVISQQGKVKWDIYSHNIKDDAKSYIEELPFITLKQSINYSDLPGVLANYDIGVILHNGHIPNYVYNAPNKLFEYLKMGLQVWLPDSLLGSVAYLENTYHPKVIAFDFRAITLQADEIVIDKNAANRHFFNAEETYQPLIEFLETPKLG